MPFNYTKWSFVIGTAIALSTIGITVAVPEVRCAIGLEKCTVQNELVDFIVKGENSQFIPGVKVYLASKGAPEVVETDSNGYAQIKIPSRGDVNINLQKEGYQAKSFTVNLKNNRENTRTITLEKLGSSTINAVSIDNSSSSLEENKKNTSLSEVSVKKAQEKHNNTSQNHSQNKSVKVIEDNSFKVELKGCYGNKKVHCDFMITNLESGDRSFRLSTNSRTIDFSGNEYGPREIRVARASKKSSDTGYTTASSALIQGVPTKARIDFDLPAQLNSLAVIEINYSDTNYQGGLYDNNVYRNIHFRNVKIDAFESSIPK